MAAAGADDTDRAGTNGRATLREVARLAEQHHFGESHATHVLGGGDVGCAGLGLGICLLPPAIGIIVGPFSSLATSIGVALLVLAVVVPYVAFRYEIRRDNRVPRLHLFDGGLIITYPTRIAVHPWGDIRIAERVEAVAYGQGGAHQRARRLELHVVEGELLCTLGGDDNTALIRRLASSGGGPT